jgi:hypothetical protein
LPKCSGMHPERYARAVRTPPTETVAAAVSAAFPETGHGGPPAPSPSSNLHHRGVLYLAEGGLAEVQFEAVSSGADAVGEDSFYLSYAERFTDPNRVQDFGIRTHDYSRYLACATLDLDHILVSVSGRWAVYVLHDGIAVVAGDDRFIAAVYSRLPAAVDQAVAFMRDILSMQQQDAKSWSVNLFRDVLGFEATDHVLATASG